MKEASVHRTRSQDMGEGWSTGPSRPWFSKGGLHHPSHWCLLKVEWLLRFKVLPRGVGLYIRLKEKKKKRLKEVGTLGVNRCIKVPSPSNLHDFLSLKKIFFSSRKMLSGFLSPSRTGLQFFLSKSILSLRQNKPAIVISPSKLVN